ncbi:serine hydrolase [Echinicola sp. CAU 1574]|uniref:Serine hydrolase n=1 Tax=Echinicola arenosa TaxID=2774144 RepID=A0ABR9AMZ2_9BACT|nr:serine hydrolase [Echinicola arenosa]MBD8490167.1 serine hydrolase [Echinicola arenosa]
MKSTLSFLIVLLLFTPQIHAQNIKRIDNSTIPVEALDSNFGRLQREANVHGLTISIITKDSILFQKPYGSRNLKEKQPLGMSHNFYAASLSKPVFAFIVMKLVDAGVIDLDKPLVEYLDRPLPSYTFKETYEGYQDLSSDERYKKITARMCLSHTTGFPNWRYIGNSGINMNKPLEIESAPGTYYSYSGEGIQLLQFVVEQVTKKRLEELAQTYVFEPFNMTMTSFLWQDRFETNYAVGHYGKKKVLERRKRNQEYAAGSMDTTPQDYAKFIQAMLAKKGLSATAYEDMFSPQISITATQQFGNNRWKITEENKNINLSYGLGWGIYETPYGKAIFKEGHMDGWEHYAIFYPSKNIGMVIMCNSSNGEGIFKELLEIAMGDRWMPWYWENFIPYDVKG